MAPILADPKKYENCVGLGERLMAMDLEKGCDWNWTLTWRNHLGNSTFGSTSTRGSDSTLGSDSTGVLVSMWRWGWGRRAVQETMAPNPYISWLNS